MNVRRCHGASGTGTARASRGRAGPADAVVEEPALRAQQGVEAPEVLGQVLAADVLEHADGADGVERPVVDVAVVLQADVHLAGEPSLLDPIRPELHLAWRHGHPDHLDAVVLGRMERHRAPSAAHVQQSHPRPQAELLADQLVLGRLSRLQAHARVVPDRARVGHGRAQHEPVEVVGEVVVVGDGGGVALARVARAAHPRLLGRGRQRPEPLDSRPGGPGPAAAPGRAAGWPWPARTARRRGPPPPRGPRRRRPDPGRGRWGRSRSAAGRQVSAPATWRRRREPLRSSRRRLRWRWGPRRGPGGRVRRCPCLFI